MSLARLEQAAPSAALPLRPPQMSLVRELTEADLARLPLALPKSSPLLRQARAVHHRGAQLIAEGRTDVEVAAIIGRSPGRIASLRCDPTFQNLVAYYAAQQVDIAFETHKRIQNQLVDILELAVTEMQARLEGEEPQTQISLSELRKTAEFAADRTIAPPRATQGGSATPPARIELNFGFVPKQLTSTTIDVTPTEES